MTYTIIVQGDTCDADYITKKTKISDEMLDFIKPVIKAIKSFESYEIKGKKFKHNFPYSELPEETLIPRKDLGEKSCEEMYGHIKGFKEFLKYCPEDIHSIVSIEIIPINATIKLL